MLRHSSDSEPGYRRQKQGKGWVYFDDAGTPVTDDRTIDRLNRIALPPAYGHAWFCKDDNGHIQATGIDARKRKQYRYHPDYRAQRESRKFHHCLPFGVALPALRGRVDQDMASPRLTREAVLGAVVRLLDEGHIRVGNEQYARENNHFGATTLRRNHLETSGDDVSIHYTGKHGIVHDVRLTDTNLKRIVRQCQELPGQHLFHYCDGADRMHAVSSSDVNAYIHETTGNQFTAKDFRTWGASVIFFDELLSAHDHRVVRLNAALAPVAHALGNTPTVARNSYIHPGLIAAVRDNPHDPLGGMKRPRATARLSSAETGFLSFLKSRPANGNSIV